MDSDDRSIDNTTPSADAAPPGGARDSGDTPALRRLFRRQLLGVWLACGVMVVAAGWGHVQSSRRHGIDFRPMGAEAAYRIDINAATWQELTALRGIGPTRAQAIVEWRQANGPFRSADDLIKVDGISERLVEGIRRDIAF